MTHESMKKALWWICLVVAPLGLIGIELFHPAGFTNDPGMYEYLSRPEHHTAQHKALDYFGPDWWFALHMIQTPLVGLVAVGLWLLMDDIGRPTFAVVAAWISRAATFVFLIYYTALDSIGGSGLGRTILITERLAGAGDLTPDQKLGVVDVLDTAWTDRWVGGVGSFISQTGSWAILLAALFGALALFLARKTKWPALLLLLGFGWELQVSHAAFHGPIAFALLVAFSLWLWWSDRRTPASAPAPGGNA